MATIINEDEGRPQLVVPRENTRYASKYESIVEEKILRDVKQQKKHTLMTMTLNEIVENTIKVVATFSQDYKKHMYQVSEDHKIRGDKLNSVNLVKQYLLAFVSYLGDKDNLLYMGIILCFVSIIIYFFSISTQNDPIP